MVVFLSMIQNTQNNNIHNRCFFLIDYPTMKATIQAYAIEIIVWVRVSIII